MIETRKSVSDALVLAQWWLAHTHNVTPLHEGSTVFRVPQIRPPERAPKPPKVGPYRLRSPHNLIIKRWAAMLLFILLNAATILALKTLWVQGLGGGL
jgi:hypothetical protein